jgi:menaquinone-specific isochorismate synthase
MIDWAAVESRLAQLAASSPPARLLSVTLALPHWPATALPAQGDWCFWQRPDHGLRLLGSGKAFGATSAGSGRFAALHAAQRGLLEGWRYAGDMLPLAFAGFAYGGGTPQDAALPNASLWVPELLLRERGDDVSLTLSCAANHAGAALERWQAAWDALLSSQTADAPQRYDNCPNPLADEAFLSRGRAALSAIAAGETDKLVLTRALRLKADAAIPAGPVLAALAAQHPACAIFGVGAAGRSFVGASPETLLALQGESVAVDALAGTAWREAALELGADKNRREHDFVAKAIAEALGELCDDVAVPSAPEIMQLNALTHLRRRVAARRTADVGVFDLIARLHPSPAVGGAPTSAALGWLERHGDRRGAWYTGGIGWIDAAGDCDIAVALRCGLLAGKEATLYAGAGFVAGSDPEQEFAETEAKLAAMHAALAAACGRSATERDAA